MPYDYGNKEVKISGDAVFLVVGGPPQACDVFLKPGFGGIMMASSEEELTERRNV